MKENTYNYILKPKVNAVVTYIMPLCLMSNGFINLVLFHFGLHEYDAIRSLVSNTILCTFFVLSLVKLIFLYQDYIAERKRIIKLCCIPALWIMTYIAAILYYGFQYKIVFSLAIFGLYCIPAFIFAISIAIERTEDKFISAFKWYALILAPLLVYYCLRIIIAPQFVYGLINIGVLSYLEVGYTLVPIFIMCFFGLLLPGGIGNKRLINGLIIILWVAVIFTGGKGPLICILLFLFLMLLLLFQRRQIKPLFSLFTVIICILLFFLFIYSPPSAGTYRTKVFIYNVLNKTTQLSTATVEDEKLISQLSPSAPEDKTVSPPGALGDKLVSKDNSPLDLGTTENKEILSKSEYGNGWERMFLWKLAIAEGNNAPLTGLGPLGYNIKYGGYPHNMILELIADFGYLFTTLFMSIIVVLTVSTFRKGKNDLDIACILVLLMSYLPSFMLSDTIYYSKELLFALGYTSAMFALKGRVQ